MSISESKIDAIDKFVANDSKMLDGYQPHWTPAWGYKDYQLSWLIIEHDTGLTRASFRFRLPMNDFEFPTIGLIFQGQMISRIDKAADNVCKPNPTMAAALGLPSIVCGTHLHGWQDNRNYVLQSGKLELPIRRPIDASFNTLNDVFFWFCNHLRVTLSPNNTPLSMPDQGLLRGPHA